MKLQEYLTQESPERQAPHSVIVQQSEMIICGCNGVHAAIKLHAFKYIYVMEVKSRNIYSQRADGTPKADTVFILETALVNTDEFLRRYGRDYIKK